MTKELEEECVKQHIGMLKQTTNTWRIMVKVKNHQSSIYDDANNLHGFGMCKKLPVIDFKWVDDLSIFTKDYIKNYDEDNDIGYNLKVDVKYPKNFHKLHSDLPFLPERMKINNCTKLVCNAQDKKTIQYTYWH